MITKINFNLFSLIILFLIIVFPHQSLSSERFVNHNQNIKLIKDNLSNLNPEKIRPLSIKSQTYILEIDNQKFITDNRGNFLVDFNDYFEVFNHGEVINNPVDRSLNEAAYSFTSTLSKNRLIHYKSELSLDHVFVLMDYTCPFCQKFHNQVKNDFLNNNIDVYYIPFRRSNESSIKENNMKVFCSEQNNHKIELYEELISYGYISDNNESKKCIYEDYYNFMDDFFFSINNLRVTPMIIGSNGIIVEGLRGFNEYKKIIGIKK